MKQKKWIIHLVLVLSLSWSNSASSASIKVKMHYLEGANLFEVVDQLSQWKSGEYFKEYKKYWDEKLKLSALEEALLDDYAKLRQKYDKSSASKSQSDESMLFSVKKYKMDYFREAFYSAKILEKGLKKLSKKLKKDEMKFLVKVYRTFKPKLEHIAAESSNFRSKEKGLEKLYRKAKIAALLKNASKFFYLKQKGRSLKINMRVLLIWWPQGQNPQIKLVNNDILLYYNPIAHIDNLDFEKVVEVLIKAIIVNQPRFQKQNISRQFFNLCKVKKDFAPLVILERPLETVFGKMMYRENLDRKNFDLYQDYAIHPWSNLYSKLLYSLVKHTIKNKEGISENFIPKAAKLCSELMAFGGFYNMIKQK
ncbi:MAG: hypothetical protein ISR65_14770 [Bacteriovoracaceae bacterium]|nr:hypothetical protein [Bacteriovoracaceae bacterium]